MSTDRRRERRESSVTEEVPACQSCRKRKLKCSRETPSCSQCSRLSCTCIYDRKKQKPGLKSGAVESLSQRIGALERMLLKDNGGEYRDAPVATSPQGCVYHAALLIANSVNGMVNDNDGSTFGGTPFNCQRDLSSSATHTTDATNSAKRRRTGDIDHTIDDQLPSQRVLGRIFQTYFAKIHPWLPCVHQPTFDARLKDPRNAERLSVLVHAMIYVTMKHIKWDDIGPEEIEMDTQMRISREAVIRLAMTNMSVESLQALIILASDYMGEGNLTSAWPIIGSLTRTVEYLQLSIEVDETRRRAFLQPVILLKDSQSWAEAEERRRVFWNIFILDRLCSVTSGWSTSLTSDDVRRRLPCDGKMWARGERAVTPHFGIWDKAAAKIGNPISYIPAPRSPSSADSLLTKANGMSPASESLQVGAFAYRIEATESLSQVTSFFLQQPVDFRNRQEVGSWLTRFKELDLRLVHWKNFLPPKWKDSNISHDEMVVKMDPNLTLAHITHNTSMILLHQHLAYPPKELNDIVRLPSGCSAETCQLAAVETSSISQKFLTYSESDIVVAQFAFCAFVAARVLLVHWKFCGTTLANEFFNLLESLRDMSRRWNGCSPAAYDNNIHHLDLAARYAALLEAMHAKCLNEPDLPTDRLFQYDITSDLKAIRGTASTSPHSTFAFGEASGVPWQAGHGPSPVSNHPGPLNTPYLHGRKPYFHPMSPGGASLVHNMDTPRPIVTGLPAGVHGQRNQPSLSTGISNTEGSGQTPEDELTLMSNVLLDQQFSDLDRVITLDGTDFAFDMSYWGSMNGAGLS